MADVIGPDFHIGRGAIVIDELVFPITDIYLDGRQFCIVARVPPGTRGVRADTYTLHDRSGQVVYTSEPLPDRFCWPAQRAALELRVDLTITSTEVGGPVRVIG